MLSIYNSMSGSKEPFTPLVEGKVGMYVCGITVYDYCHLGHARMLVVFDMVNRYLREQGYDVTYVRNLTDIDDKIIARANENGETIQALTSRFIHAMNADMAALNLLTPDHEPKATEHIQQIIDMNKQLLDKGLAYVADNGDVYYDVSEFKDYGQLSRKNTEDLRAGARVEVSAAKDDPLDFVLWKAAKPDEPNWDSPWGAGRPGWHIECSAMSTHALGTHFDIHGGGMDLQFPHHENEIAQSCGASGDKFANLWMHNGFVRVDDEKMSKSLGNFSTIRDILKQYQPEVIRLFILSSHYRSPLNYADEHLHAAKASLNRLYTALRGTDAKPDQVQQTQIQQTWVERFHEAMDDDFNSRAAVTLMHELAGELNKQTDKTSQAASDLAKTLRHLGGVIGLLQDDANAFLQGGSTYTDSDTDTNTDKHKHNDAEIQVLIDERITAKAAKNYVRADEIRTRLDAIGIILEDSATDTTWRRK